MRAVFAVLRKTGFAWKTNSPYSLRCRSGGPAPATPAPTPAPPAVKIALQLFKVRDDRYLVDLKYLDGPIYLFFDEAVKVLLELQTAVGAKAEPVRA
jgi:5'-AMP-activated protein kinase catalytic alpha subunit